MKKFHIWDEEFEITESIEKRAEINRAFMKLADGLDIDFKNSFFTKDDEIDLYNNLDKYVNHFVYSACEEAVKWLQKYDIYQFDVKRFFDEFAFGWIDDLYDYVEEIKSNKGIDSVSEWKEKLGSHIYDAITKVKYALEEAIKKYGELEEVSEYYELAKDIAERILNDEIPEEKRSRAIYKMWNAAPFSVRCYQLLYFFNECDIAELDNFTETMGFVSRRLKNERVNVLYDSLEKAGKCNPEYTALLMSHLGITVKDFSLQYKESAMKIMFMFYYVDTDNLKELAKKIDFTNSQDIEKKIAEKDFLFLSDTFSDDDIDGQIKSMLTSKLSEEKGFGSIRGRRNALNYITKCAISDSLKKEIAEIVESNWNERNNELLNSMIQQFKETAEKNKKCKVCLLDKINMLEDYDVRQYLNIYETPIGFFRNLKTKEFILITDHKIVFTSNTQKTMVNYFKSKDKYSFDDFGIKYNGKKYDSRVLTAFDENFLNVLAYGLGGLLTWHEDSYPQKKCDAKTALDEMGPYDKLNKDELNLYLKELIQEYDPRGLIDIIEDIKLKLYGMEKPNKLCEYQELLEQEKTASYYDLSDIRKSLENYKDAPGAIDHIISLKDKLDSLAKKESEKLLKEISCMSREGLNSVENLIEKLPKEEREKCYKAVEYRQISLKDAEERQKTIDEINQLVNGYDTKNHTQLLEMLEYLELYSKDYTKDIVKKINARINDLENNGINNLFIGLEDKALSDVLEVKNEIKKLPYSKNRIDDALVRIEKIIKKRVDIEVSALMSGYENLDVNSLRSLRGKLGEYPAEYVQKESNQIDELIDKIEIAELTAGYETKGRAELVEIRSELQRYPFNLAGEIEGSIKERIDSLELAEIAELMDGIEVKNLDELKFIKNQLSTFNPDFTSKEFEIIKSCIDKREDFELDELVQIDGKSEEELLHMIDEVWELKVNRAKASTAVDKINKKISSIHDMEIQEQYGNRRIGELDIYELYELRDKVNSSLWNDQEINRVLSKIKNSMMDIIKANVGMIYATFNRSSGVANDATSGCWAQHSNGTTADKKVLAEFSKFNMEEDYGIFAQMSESFLGERSGVVFSFKEIRVCGKEPKTIPLYRIRSFGSKSKLLSAEYYAALDDGSAVGIPFKTIISAKETANILNALLNSIKLSEIYRFYNRDVIPAQPIVPPAPQPVTPPPAPQAAVLARKFCGQCGAPIEPGARFCIKCGNKLF